MDFFSNALPGDIFDRLQTATSFLPDEKKHNVDFMMSSAKDLLHRCNQGNNGGAQGSSNERSTAGAHEANDSTNGFNKSKHANTGSSSSASSSANKPSSGKFCSFHRDRTHNTEDCRAAGKTKDTSSAPSSYQSKESAESQWANYGNSSSAAPASKNKCGALGWTPQHRCNTARRDNSPPHFSGMAVGNNAAAEIATPAATSSQLDVAISELIIEADVAKQAQLGKSHSIFSEPPKHI